MSSSTRSHNSVVEILRHLDCTEIRPAGSEQWVPISEVSGKYGTTDDVEVLTSYGGSDRTCVADPDTGELLAEAREGSEKARVADEDSRDDKLGTDDEEEKEDLDRLRDKATCPNVRTAAYLAQLALRRMVDGSPNHKQLVTAANLAALKAWDEGLALTDLDKIWFSASEEDMPQVVIGSASGSVSVRLRDRPYALEEPWGGSYDFSKVCATAASSEEQD